MNTILSNIENGVTAIEIDIKLTKDNKLVLFRDDTLDRLLDTYSDLLVTEFTLAELKEMPLRDSSQGLQYRVFFR